MNSTGSYSRWNELLEKAKTLFSMEKKKLAVVIVTFLAVIVSPFFPFVGASIVGFFVGYFLSDEIKSKLNLAITLFETQRQMHVCLLVALSLCVFFVLPSLLFSLLAGLGVRSLVMSK